MEGNVDVNARDDIGRTALFIAADRGYLRIIKMLVSCGADVSIQDNDGLSALHVASKQSHEEIVKFFIRNGADVNALNTKGEPPISRATEFKVFKHLMSNGARIPDLDQNGNSMLNRSLLLSMNYIYWLCEQKSDQVDILSRHWWGSLDKLIIWCLLNFRIMQWLIKHGANVNAQGQMGLPLIHLVKGLKTVRWLLAKGTDPNSLVSSHYSRLRKAIFDMKLELIPELVESDALVNLSSGPDSDSITAFEAYHRKMRNLNSEAARSRLSEIVQYLSPPRL